MAVTTGTKSSEAWLLISERFSLTLILSYLRSVWRNFKRTNRKQRSWEENTKLHGNAWKSSPYQKLLAKWFLFQTRNQAKVFNLVIDGLYSHSYSYWFVVHFDWCLRQRYMADRLLEDWDCGPTIHCQRAGMSVFIECTKTFGVTPKTWVTKLLRWTK